MRFLPLFALLALASAACPSSSGYTNWSKLFTGLAQGSTVNIAANQNVLLDVAPSVTLGTITVSGTLLIPDVTQELLTTGMVVTSTGSLVAGSIDCPLNNKFTLTLCGGPPTPRNLSTLGSDEDFWAGTIKYGSKGLIVSKGGQLRLFGRVSGPAWTQLTATVPAGSSTLKLKDAVSWRSGDQITISSTDYSEYYNINSYKDANGVVQQTQMTGQGGNFPDQSEYATIKTVSSDGKTVTLNSPVKYLKWGVWPETAEVGLLSRSIVIRGDAGSDATFFGGHLLIRSPNAQISGVEFTRMGQLGNLGRYPVHFHIARDATGSFVVNSSVHTNYQRCIAIHNTNNVVVADTVSFNTYGHCIFFEDGAEMGNVLDHNLVIWSRPMNDSNLLIATDNQPSSVWIVNPNNTFTNNAVSSAFHGYWWVMPVKPKGGSTAEYSNITTLYPRYMTCPLFDNNIAHSIFQFGIMIDEFLNAEDIMEGGAWQPQNYPYLVPGTTQWGGLANQLLTRYVTWRTRKGGMWSRCQTCYWEDCVFAETGQMGTFTLNSQLIRNSYYIGRTDNPGTPLPGWNYTLADSYLTIGTPYYKMHGGSMPYDAGGQTLVINCLFENFTSTPYTEAGAMRGSDASQYRLIRNQLIGSKLINSEPVRIRNYTDFTGQPLWPSGYTLLHDGALTGVLGGGWVVGWNPYWSTRPECAWRYAGNCYYCNLKSGGIGQLQVYTTFASSPLDTSDTTSSYSIYTNTMAMHPLGLGNSMSAAYFGVQDDGWIANIPTHTYWSLQWLDSNGKSLQSPQTMQFVQNEAHMGDYNIVAVPYPSGTTFTVVNPSTGLTLTPASSLQALTPYTYFYNSVDGHLYLWITPDVSTAGIQNEFGVLLQNAQGKLSVTASCTTCNHGALQVPNAFTPDALSTDDYRADLLPCNASPSSAYGNGTVFVQVYPNSFTGQPTLSYQAYHDSGASALIRLEDNNGGVVGYFDVGTTGSSSNILLFRSVWELLTSGNLYVSVRNADGSESLRGKMYSLSPSTIRRPAGASNVDPCNPGYSYLNYYNWQTSTVRGRQYNNFGLWNSTYTADELCSGQPVLELQLGNPMASVEIHAFNNNGSSIAVSSAYTALEFYVKLPTYIPFNMAVWANGAYNNKVSVNVSMIAEYAINTYKWSLVRIPLSSLNVGTSLTWLNFGQTSNLYNANVLIDQIRLVPSASLPRSTTSAVPPAYSQQQCPYAVSAHPSNFPNWPGQLVAGSPSVNGGDDNPTAGTQNLSPVNSGSILAPAALFLAVVLFLAL